MSPSLIIAGQVTLLVGLSFILMRAARLTASVSETAVNHSRQRKFSLVVFFIALSTSLPELVMTIMASVAGQGELALAILMGANIASISIILGGAAVMAGSLRASDAVIKKDIGIVFLIGCLPLLLLMDGQLSRIEGLALILLYISYIYPEFRRKQGQPIPPPKAERQIAGLLHQFQGLEKEKRSLLFLGGVAVMVVSAYLLITMASTLAVYAMLPLFLIGLFILGVGSSLPELLFELVAIRQRQSTMAFGNIVGSIATNGTVILGLSAMIHPIILGKSMMSYLISNIAFILIFGLFWWFVKSKHRLDRWEGLVLVVVFGLFGVIQFLTR